MEAKQIDLGKVLSEISSSEKRSQRRSVIYTVVSLLIGAIWLSYSIIEVSSLRREASGLRKEKANLDTDIARGKDKIEGLQADISRLDELRYARLREWGWLEETIAKVEQSAKANDERQAIASDTDTPANLERRKSITIEYFLKNVDKDKVLAALGGLGFTALRQSPALGTTPTNAVWFGRSVQIDDAKLVAYTLIRAGIQIKDIRPYLVSEGRDSLIQVGGRPLAVNKPVWTVERISAAKEFPRE
jgi:hypothetical protein